MARRTGIVKEFFLFLKTHKAYWMAPIIVVLLLFTAIIVLGGTAVAPFIYTLF